MSDLIALSKADMKRLGIVEGKNGLLVDKKRLAEIKKFQRVDKDDPTKQVEVKQVAVKDMIKETVKQKDSDIGIF